MVVDLVVLNTAVDTADPRTVEDTVEASAVPHLLHMVEQVMDSRRGTGITQ